jgi:hypothetical protein
MPVTSSDRYSVVSLSSASSSTSSTNYYNNLSSQSSSTFSPLRSAASSLHLSKLFNTDYRSMQSLKIQQQQQQQYSTNRNYHPPIACVSPLVRNQQTDFHSKDENWLSCEELENIEKRFTDLLQNTNQKKSLDYQHSEQRAKSCDRLTIDEQNYKPTTMTSKWRIRRISIIMIYSF